MTLDINSKNGSGSNKLRLSLDLRIITLLLLAVIAGMLFMWKPWTSASADDRTVTVTGEAKLTESPDEFVFYPSYAFKNADKDAALAELTKKSNQVVAKLKELGVAENKIKTNSNGYDQPVPERGNNSSTYNLQLTVTVDNFTLAEKVQDYLVSTTPSGAVSPQANFSDKKRKELEDKARNEAAKDARSKADQMAKNLGFELGKVKSISDGTGFGIPPIYAQERGAPSVAEDKQLTIQPGENDLSYSITVIYFIH